MLVTFANGTSRQHGLFNSAVAASIYPWDRLTTHVTVQFVDVTGLGGGFDGETTWSTTILDACGRPNAATIQLRNGIEREQGDDYFRTVVIHELGHVVQSKFSTAQIAAMSALFNGTPAEWASSESTANWGDMRQESYAETFKDVWLPKPTRTYDNKSNHRLAQSNYEAFLAILDEICPCNAVVLYDDGGGGPILT